MSKLKFALFGLTIAVLIGSGMVFACGGGGPPGGGFYEGSTTFNTYFNSTTITATDEYLGIYFENINGHPLWIDTQFAGNETTTTAHEGGGGGGLEIASCAVIDDIFEVCKEKIHGHDDVFLLTARPVESDRMVEFFVRRANIHNDPATLVLVRGGIVRPDVRVIVNNDDIAAIVTLAR